MLADPSGIPSVRCWFFDPSETRLIQLQHNHFIHNWRKTAATQGYQHYEVVKPLFQKEWRRFCSFVAANAMRRPEVWQSEVTYVNHIERGQGWETFADLPLVMTSWSGKTATQFLPDPDTVAWNCVYPMPDSAGQLNVNLQRAIRKTDGKDIIQLTLTAKGKPASAEDGDLFAWLDLGHEWVVRGFKDVTTAKMHQFWGVK
jgi:uncharacterized protein (TIGR04255 family)